MKQLQPEDSLKLKSIPSAGISADGRSVVYALRSYNEEEERFETRLQLTGDDGDRRLTSGPGDSRPSWSPDGERIAFVAKRSEKNQIHLIRPDGGEARPLETKHEPSSQLHWSPDGKRIAFSARITREPDGPRYPAEPRDLPLDEDSDDSDEEKPRVITELHYQNDQTGFTHHRRPQIFAVDVESGKTQKLTEKFVRHDKMCWHPKGEKLAYTVRQYDQENIAWVTALREVDLRTGADSPICTWDGSVSSVAYSPCGRWLVLSATDNSVPQGCGNTHLWALDLHDQTLPAEPEDLTDLLADLDRSVMGDFGWSPDGEGLYAVIGDSGRMIPHALQFDPDSPESADLSALEPARIGVVSHLDIAQDSGHLMYLAQDFSHPPQLYVQMPYEPAKNARKLTDVNEEFLSDYPIMQAESYTYEGADDWEIQGWVVKPAGYEDGRKYPTVLSIHGGPNGAYTDSFSFAFQMLAHAGFCVVFTNPRGSIGYGEEFAQGVVQDWGGGDFEDIMSGLDWVVQQGIADPNRLGVMGWSYGGYMTLWSVTQTDRFACAVAGATISNIYSLWGTSDIAAVYNEHLMRAPAFADEQQYMGRSPMRHAENADTPLLILHGEADVRTPIGESEQFYTAMQRLGREAVFVRYPGQHHQFKKPEFIIDRWARTLAWFGHYLMPSD